MKGYCQQAAEDGLVEIVKLNDDEEDEEDNTNNLNKQILHVFLVLLKNFFRE